MIKFVRFTELPVSNQDRAVRFYTEKLGLTIGQDAPYEEGWRWIELRIAGAETGIVLTRKADDSETGVPSLVLEVDDVKAAHRELEGKGVVFTQEPTQAPWDPGQSYALFRDSEGNTIMLGSD